MKAVGFGDTAPRAILAHEFGYQVHYADGLFDNTKLTGPEATRRTELMTDAFGTYRPAGAGLREDLQPGRRLRLHQR
ncbi:hypothetical protein ACGF0D_09445 [Kitasatospora sp. NPDC048298]|uniref:hypothetical protein n=1 Tax=Kitasatospora sp. NPDC048298 TaxID=3364049 RepID=UPI003715043E